jgi:arylsulfatase A-like enzyme
VKPGRRVNDFVSLTDLAPTFLDAAGVTTPAAMTGRSLLPVLTVEGEGRIDPKRDFVVFGRERHVPAQEIPSLAGYPARGLRTDRWLLILNLEHDRWPAGVPTGASHPIDVHADCDNGPTKSFIVAHKSEPKYAKYFELCFAKRPAVELYDCVADPDQVNNLATDPKHAQTVAQLRSQLAAYLKATADPRFTDGPVEFDDYPYRARYLEEYLKKRGYF